MDKVSFHQHGGEKSFGDKKDFQRRSRKIKQNNSVNLGSPPIEEHILIKWYRMIANAKTEIVLEKLVEYFINSSYKQCYFKEAILMSNRWNSLERDFNNGRITYDEYCCFKNRICNSLLSFLGQS